MGSPRFLGDDSWYVVPPRSPPWVSRGSLARFPLALVQRFKKFQEVLEVLEIQELPEAAASAQASEVPEVTEVTGVTGVLEV